MTAKQPRYRGLFLHPILLLVLSLTGLGLSVLLVLMFGVAGIMALVQEQQNSDLLSLFNMAWTALLVGGLFLFPVVQSILQLSRRETRFFTKSRLAPATVMMVLWLPLLLLGQTVAEKDLLPWLILPPLQLFLVVAPVFFLVELARRKLPQPEGAAWGVYGIGVVLVQPLVIIVELAALLVMGGVLLAWLSTEPDLWWELNQVIERLTYAQQDLRLMEQILLPYLKSPIFSIGIVVVGAGIMPLLEEMLKPLAAWVMAGRKVEESTGFVIGLFAGGVFALIESLGIAASASLETWGTLLTGRIGTDVLHVTTTALMGWGLATAWKHGRYVRLGLIFLASFALHSVWNAFVLLLGLETYLPEQMSGWLKPVGPVVLVVLAVVMVMILVTVNLRLQRVETGRKQTGIVPATPMLAAETRPVESRDDLEA